MIQVKSFASTALINQAKEFQNKLDFLDGDGLIVPGAVNGMIEYEDNISIVFGQKYTGKIIKSKYADPKLPEKDEAELIKNLEEKTKDIMPEIPRTLSVYLENDILVRCINIKSR